MKQHSSQYTETEPDGNNEWTLISDGAATMWWVAQLKPNSLERIHLIEMETERFGHQSAVLKDEMYLVGGGNNQVETGLASTEVVQIDEALCEIINDSDGSCMLSSTNATMLRERISCLKFTDSQDLFSRQEDLNVLVPWKSASFTLFHGVL